MHRRASLFPFNNALLLTVLDAIESCNASSSRAFNVNIDSLMCYGESAYRYISKTFFEAFFAVCGSESARERVSIIELAHKERERYMQLNVGLD